MTVTDLHSNHRFFEMHYAHTDSSVGLCAPNCTRVRFVLSAVLDMHDLGTS